MHDLIARLMPSHFSGIAMITSTPSSEVLSGVKSPDQAHDRTSRDFQLWWNSAAGQAP